MLAKTFLQYPYKICERNKRPKIVCGISDDPKEGLV